MLLPGLQPQEELQELARFFTACKEHIASQPAEHSSDVQITNNRDENKRVFGKVACRRGVGNHQAAEVAQASQRLRALVEESSVLTAWLREVALTLGKVGPWSWWCVTEKQVFAEGERPHENHIREKVRAEFQAKRGAPAAAVVKPDATPNTPRP